jgi:hypothetical protein
VREENLHVADDQLLLHAEGEMGSSASGAIGAHLESCSRCRARSKELGSVLAEFGAAHEKQWPADLPQMAASRALLKARLAELAPQERGQGWMRSAWFAAMAHRQVAAATGVGIAALLLLAIQLHGPTEVSEVRSASIQRWEEPNLRLTPGATVPVTENEVCGTGAEQVVRVVPASLKQKVFEEYGVTPPQPDAYEVDYLITPELGGATDIRNLWPEPYQHTVWNAHVKDQLEDRLHGMVCRGDLDLTTAQHDISTDWIAAYRKYFHADKPVADNSSSDFDGSLPRT